MNKVFPKACTLYRLLTCLFLRSRSMLTAEVAMLGVTLTEGGSREMVFLRPRFVVPGTLGPTMDDVYLMISVSGGSRTPPSTLPGSLELLDNTFLEYATIIPSK